MNSDPVTTTTIGILIFVPLLIAAYLIARWRLGDWSSRRDPLMLLWVVVCGLIVIGLVHGPPILIRIVIPSILVVAGGYLLLTPARVGRNIRTLAGWLVVASGIGWLLLAGLRPL